jgi:hypothetical protein
MNTNINYNNSIEIKFNSSTDHAWVIIRSLKNDKNNNGYKLNKGDIFKLGRVKFRIKNFNINNDNNSTYEDELSN